MSDGCLFDFLPSPADTKYVLLARVVCTLSVLFMSVYMFTCDVIVFLLFTRTCTVKSQTLIVGFSKTLTHPHPPAPHPPSPYQNNNPITGCRIGFLPFLGGTFNHIALSVRDR